MRFPTKLITEIAMMLALSAVLAQLPIYRMPHGGTVTAATVPLFLLALRHGVKVGILGGVLAGTLQMIFDPFFVHPAQVLLDYQLAWGAVGCAGILRAWPALALILGMFGRFVFHFLSGMIFFAQYAPEGSQTGVGLITYVAGYNASYMIPEAVMAMIIILLLHHTTKLTKPIRYPLS